jgi:hypothetical protein
MFIGIVCGRIAGQIRARISSVNSDLRRGDLRRGGLTSSRGKQKSLDLMGKRVSSMLQRRAAARVRELRYIEQAATEIPSSGLPQSSNQLSALVDPPGGLDQQKEKRIPGHQDWQQQVVMRHQGEPPEHPVLRDWIINQKLTNLELNYEHDLGSEPSKIEESSVANPPVADDSVHAGKTQTARQRVEGCLPNGNRIGPVCE